MTRIQSQHPPQRKDRFWPFFWLTILILLAVYVYAQLQAHKLRVDAAGKVVLADYVLPQWDKLLPRLLEQRDLQLDGLARAEIGALIDTNIDAAFAPVYGQIPKLADVHYSVIGEYTEIGAAALGRLEGRIGGILFDEVDFRERLAGAVGGIVSGSDAAIGGALDQIEGKIQVGMSFSREEMGLLGSALELTVQDMQARFGEVSLGLRGLGAAGGAAAAGTLLAKGSGAKLSGAIATKLAGKVAVKAGSKAAVKAAGIGGGAAAGAAIGSVVPGVGTAVGGVVGAVAAWLITDKVVVEADELFNRDRFEADLRAMLDTEKQRIKTDLQAGYDAYLSRISEHTEQQLRGLRPVDLIDSR
jgi:hypothetical protein